LAAFLEDFLDERFEALLEDRFEADLEALLEDRLEDFLEALLDERFEDFLDARFEADLEALLDELRLDAVFSASILARFAAVFCIHRFVIGLYSGLSDGHLDIFIVDLITTIKMDSRFQTTADVDFAAGKRKTKKSEIVSANVTETLQSLLPDQAFLYNPSISHVTGSTYLMSVRINRGFADKKMDYNPKLHENTQHPWAVGWLTELHGSYLLLVSIKNDTIAPIKHPGYPIYIDKSEDIRLFRYYDDKDCSAYIVYYNTRVQDPEVVRKDGETCAVECIPVVWNHLIIDKSSLQPIFTRTDKPRTICIRISTRIDKNWGLFTVERHNSIRMMNIYGLSPFKIFEIRMDETMSDLNTCSTVYPYNTDIDEIFDYNYGDSDSSSSGNSRLTSNYKQKIPKRNIVKPDTNGFFHELEQYYMVDGKKILYVSSSTPAFKVDEIEHADHTTYTYQGIGHIKIIHHFLNDTMKGKPAYSLLDHLNFDSYLHGVLVYFTFVYRFELDIFHDADQTTEDFQVRVVSATDSFVCNTVDTIRYFLNFAAGQEILPNGDTLITYGDGDYDSHVMRIPASKLEKMLKPVSKLKPSTYKFKVLEC